MNTYSKYLFLILSLSLLLYSCSEENVHKEEVQVQNKIEVLDALSVFDATENSQTITFLSTSDWKAYTDQNWCSVTPGSGSSGKKSISVSVQSNEDYNERNATLILSSGTIEKRLTIVQKQGMALLLSSSKKELSAEGGLVEITVKSNVEYSYSVEESAVEWVVPVASRGLKTSTVHFKIKENDGLEKREAKIFFKYGDKNEVFTIYQDGTNPELVLTQDTYNIDSEGGEIKVELKSNFAYQILMPDVDWIHKSESRSISTYTHYFVISPNKNYDGRTADITFKQITTGISKKVTINQYQKNELIIDGNECTVDAEGGPISIKLKTNTSFKVKCPSWITQVDNVSRALQERTINFIVEKNPRNTERSGIIILTSDNVYKEIKVIQEGRYSIKIHSELTDFGSKEETQEVVFTSLGDWTAHTNEDWCHITPPCGKSGSNTIKVSVKEINNVARRVDSLYIESGNLHTVLPIVQKNEDSLLVVTPDIKMSGRNDTIISIRLKAAYDVSVAVEESARKWIIPLSTRSLQETVWEFKVLKNLNVLKRTGIITFMNGEKKQDFTITQDGIGPIMEIEPTKLQLGSSASEFEVTVKSNYKYRVWNGGEIKWIKLLDSKVLPSQEDGFTITKHRFHIDENVSIDLRIGYINFYNTEYIVEFGQIDTNLLRVFQRSKYTIDIPISEYEVPSQGKILSFDVLSDVDFQVKTSVPWISQLPQSRGPVKNTNLQFKVDVNTGIEPRVGIITLSYQDWSKKIQVFQEAYKDYGIFLVDSLAEFSPVGGTQTMNFKASESWTVFTDADWLSLSSRAGASGANQLTVIANANSEYQQRQAMLIFKCGKHTKQVSVIQNQNDHIEVGSSEYTLAWNVANFNLKVQSNCKYTVDIAATGNWIRRNSSTRALVTDIIPFIVDNNETESQRVATITLKHGDIIEKVKVRQNHLDSLMILSPDVTLANATDTIIDVKLTASSDVRVEVNGNAKEWIVPMQLSRGMQENQYRFKILKNVVVDRVGTITFGSGSQSASYTVKQMGQGLQMQLSTDKIEASSIGSDFEVNVTSNFDYRVELDNQWVKEVSSDIIQKNDGFVTKRHRFSIAPNQSPEPRTMNISFVNTEYGGLTSSVNNKILVTQEGKDEIRIPAESYAVPAGGQELTFDVESNVDFKVSSSPWIRYIPNSRGSFAKSTLKFFVEKNWVTQQREGFIILSSNLTEKKIIVTQDALDDYGIRLISQPSEYDSKGGIQDIKFDSSRNWLVSSVDEWCKVSVDRGVAGENNVIKVEVLPNPDFMARDSKVVIQSESGSQIVSVMQKPKERILEVQKSVYDVTWDVTELRVDVTANCEYTVQSSVPWITVKKASKTLTESTEILVLEQNQTESERLGTITFTAGDVVKTVTVKQGAYIKNESTPDTEVNPDEKPDTDPNSDPDSGTKPETDPTSEV